MSIGKETVTAKRGITICLSLCNRHQPTSNHCRRRHAHGGNGTNKCSSLYLVGGRCVSGLSFCMESYLLPASNSGGGGGWSCCAGMLVCWCGAVMDMDAGSRTRNKKQETRKKKEHDGRPQVDTSTHTCLSYSNPHETLDRFTRK